MIVDRVFQPIADRLAHRVSHFDLARNALVAMLVMGGVSLTLRPDLMIPFMMGLVIFIWGGFALVTTHHITQAERAPRNTANPLRLTRLGSRTLAVMVLLAGLVTAAARIAFDIPGAGLPAYSFTFLSNLAWIALEGFAACEARPSQPRPAAVRLAGVAIVEGRRL